jgi:predicted ribosomally synthesized peptide with SipW-like signal peptide
MKKSFFTKNKLTAFFICLLLVAGTVGGSLAYLTDSEKAVNTFTVGNVAAEAFEPTYPGNDSPEVKNLVPNEEVAKDPMLVNTGTTDAIIFAVVDSPMEMITVTTDSGAIDTSINNGQKAANDLFWFKDVAQGASVHQNTFDSNWTELTAKEMYVVITTANDGTETEESIQLSQIPAKLAEIHPAGGPRQNVRVVKRYVFGYNTKVQGSDTTDGTAQVPGTGMNEASGTVNDRTTKLFDKVQLKNVLPGEIDGTTEPVVVRTYAIQAAKILENGTDITETLNATNLGKIYDVFVGQNSTNNDTTGLKVIGMRDIDDVSKTTDGASGEETQHVNRWNTTTDVSGGTDHPNVNPNH